MPQNLSQANITFSVSGVEAVKAALDNVQKQLQQIQSGVNTVGPLITNVLSAAQAQLEGFVRAGIASSTVGFVFGFQMERISRGIASLFLPAIRLALDYLRQFADWLNRLSGAQQQNIVRWIAAGAAMLAVVLIIPRVIAGIGALIAGLKALALALAGAEGAAGFGAFLPLIGAVVTGLTALAVGTEVGRQGLGGLWAAVKPLVDGFGKLFAQLWASAEPIMGQLAALFEMVQASVTRMMPVFQQMAASWGDALGTAGMMIVRVLGMALSSLLRLTEGLAPLVAAMQKVSAALYHVLAPDLELLTTLLLASLEPFEGLIVLAADVAAGLMDELAPALQDVGDALGEALAPIMGLVNDLMASFRELIVELTPWLVALGRLIAYELVVALRALAGALRVVAQTLEFLTGKKYKLDLDVKPVKPLDAKSAERAPAIPAGFEQVEQTWQRIAQASVKATLGRSVPEEQRDLLREIRDNTGGVTPAIKNIKPPVVP